MSEFQKESLTLEETNRVRISLGLKPLEDDNAAALPESSGAPVSQVAQDAISERNFEVLRRSERAAADEAALRDRIAKTRNRRDLNRRLEGTGLADDGDDGSARDWLKRAARRQRENAARPKAAEMPAPQAGYGAQDIAGMHVAHSMEDLGSGDHILTLRDADVLDDAEDELIDVKIAQTERDRANAERNQRAKPYSGIDDGEGPRGVLSKYDSHEGLDAQMNMKQSDIGFRIGDAPPPEPTQELPDMDAVRKLTSIDYEKNVETSDYLPEIRFKSGKKRRAPRVKVSVDESPAEPAVQQPRMVTAENFIDDDEIAAALTRERRQRAKQQMAKVTPEMIKQNLEKAAESEAQNTQPEGLIIDETAEFVRSISEKAKVAEETEPDTRVERAPQTNDVQMTDAEEDTQPVLDPEPEPVDDALEQAMEGVREAPTDDVLDGAEPESHEEPAVNNGVAAALQVLRRQGIVEEHSPDLVDREVRQKHYDAWMNERRREDREHATEPVGEMRERDRRLYEKREAEHAMERFRDYNPDINIEYHDEFGRTLSQKEAWKRLSHVFHGKAPGHKAQEKRLRRIEEEQRRERLLAGDTLSGMSKAFLERSERLGQAHMVLSVGNHGNAPQEPDMLNTDIVSDPPSAPKPAKKTVTKKRRIPVADEPTTPDTIAAPAVTTAPTSPAPDTTAPASAMRPAFARTMKTVETGTSVLPNRPTGPPPGLASAAGAPTDAPPGAPPASEAPRERVRISLGKRKAD